jgi:hypothetical protein
MVLPSALMPVGARLAPTASIVVGSKAPPTAVSVPAVASYSCTFAGPTMVHCTSLLLLRARSMNVTFVPSELMLAEVPPPASGFVVDPAAWLTSVFVPVLASQR